MSSATVIVRAGGAIWLNPFATVLFSVTVEYCVLYAWVCLVCLLLSREEGSSPVSLQLLTGFWDRDYVSLLPCVRYYVFVKNSLNILVRNASPRGHMCFRCLIFSLSGPCYFCFVLLPLGPEKW